ncbi:unnamed protein product [Urochloa decumbens]|uniref:Uncharacterized protein n=1 Tax=Urochloa decumbens TaxID=240449 RepID=A0ABC9DT67_9POAL
MVNPKPPTDPNPTAEAPAAARARRFPWTSVAVVIGLAFNLVLCVSRAAAAGGDRAAVAFAASSHLNLFLLLWFLRRFEASPPGSVARRRARLAVWLLTTSLTAAFTWKVGALLPLVPAVVAWAMATATVLFGSYVLFAHDDK